jgi:hypothetical protein
MTAKKIFVYIVSLLMLILPVPGRTACGIALLLLFNIIVCAGTLCYRAIVFLKLELLCQILMIFFVLFVTIFYKQLVTLFSPVLALTLGISFYITALCAYEITGFAGSVPETIRTKAGLREVLAENMKRSLIFSATAFVLFVIRELMGYGALSLPSPSGMMELVFPFSGVFTTSIFWASIPGAVMSASIILALATFVYRKIFEVPGRTQHEQ